MTENFGRRRIFWMTENHFQISTQLFFLFFSNWPPPAILEVRFAPETIGFFHYVLSMAMPNYDVDRWIYDKVRAATSFLSIFYKISARGHFVFPIDAKNQRVLVIWVLNGYGEYEFDWCMCDKGIACTSALYRRQRRRRRSNQKHNTPKYNCLTVCSWSVAMYLTMCAYNMGLCICQYVIILCGHVYSNVCSWNVAMYLAMNNNSTACFNNVKSIQTVSWLFHTFSFWCLCQ